MFIMSYSFFLMELEWNPNWINGDKKQSTLWHMGDVTSKKTLKHTINQSMFIKTENVTSKTGDVASY